MDYGDNALGVAARPGALLRRASVASREPGEEPFSARAGADRDQQGAELDLEERAPVPPPDRETLAAVD